MRYALLPMAGLGACLFVSAAAAQHIVVVLPASVRTLHSVVVLPSPLPDQNEARVRSRATGSMADLYPIDGAGFHLSVGLRFFSNRSLLRDPQATRGLFYLPRTPGNPANRWGYRRAPSFAMGYTQPIGEDFTLGIEAGTMLSRATMLRRIGPHRGDRARGPNSILHLDFGVRF